MSNNSKRRVDDEKILIKLTAIGSYVGLAALAGAVVLWIGDSRIDQGTRRISDGQISMKVKIQMNSERIISTDSKLDKINEKLDKLTQYLMKP